MKIKFCGAALGLLFACFVEGGCSTGYAQNFPQRPVKLLTDVGTGGTYDIFAPTAGELFGFLLR